MAFGDTTCDCRDQLELTIKNCVENGSGIIIEIPSQDGRGWGDYKMANQRLMDEFSINTVQAAKIFYGHENMIDRRTYDECILILKSLGFNKEHTFLLGTNNPNKIKAFTKYDFKIESQPVVARHLNSVARSGLNAKAKEWGHILEKAT